jgi:two-component sensor histidine kinase
VLYFGVWTLAGLFDAAQSCLHSLHARQPFDVWRNLVIGISDWYVLAALTPGIFWLARRFPVEPPHRVRDGALHVGAGILCSLIVIGLSVPVCEAVRYPCPLRGKIPLSDAYRHVFFAKFQLYLLLYWMLVGISRGLDYYQKFRERELRTSQLEAQLATAQLQVLKMQLQPHFLFNTLHAISALIHQDVELAEKMIARLGELLRTTLDNAGMQEVTLRQELEFIKPYLEIEQARLGPRLSIRFDIDPSVMDACVPNLLLQPLVENAIRHGLAPRAAPGRIEISASREQDWLHVTVRDNGRGLSSNYSEGVGVSNTRARLRGLYGAAHRFDLRNHPDGGLQVTVIVPFREQSDEVPTAHGKPTLVRSLEP